ncbi:hypothetical protein [Lacipirellula sp.]|uniref:hypothetical protein n=1 Tax=Lacipirellula sp. TaxID=2691419 RepID=UPI003D120204
MTLPSNNLAINPVIKGNLRGLAGLAVEVQAELLQLPALYGQLDPGKLQKQFESRLTQAGLSVSRDEPATLVVSLAADVRQIAYLGGVAALYAVDTTLREVVPLPRVGNDPNNSSGGAIVDTWRQKELTGILLPRTSLQQASSLLIGECRRLVDGFIGAWQADQSDGPPQKQTEDPPIKRPDDPTDPKLQKIRQELERLLQPLAQGNEGSVSLEKFDVDGTKVSFKARIRHKHVIKVLTQKVTAYAMTTHASGEFDVADPKSLNVQACVDKPEVLGGGKLCVSLGDLVKLI